VFSPDVEPLASGDWRGRLDASVGRNHDLLRLTNSWAEPPPGGDIHVTSGTQRATMRLSRKILGREPPRWSPTLRGTIARAFATAIGSDLLEGIRATDPDLIVSLHDGWTDYLRRSIRGWQMAWPCITLGDPVPPLDQTWRRYDPAAKISIVLPTYNGVRYLAQSIVSCLAQTHTNLELIVVDDGSSEPVSRIVAGFDDPRVIFVRLPRNRGLPSALNAGFGRVTGDYCTWTSDDNYYAPQALERMLSFLQTYPKCDFVYAESYRIDDSNDDRVQPRSIIRTRPPESLADDNFIGGCFLYKRAVSETIGPYNTTATLAEDYEYWVRVHHQFTMQRLLEPLYTYRFHEASLTSRHGAEDVAGVVRKVKQAHGIGRRS